MSDNMIRQLKQNGWCPVPTKHHLPEVKAALRAFGIRPAVKQCFANCQRFVVSANYEGMFIGRVRYCEGFCVGEFGPFHHAWLELDGSILDLTLLPTDDVTYDERFTATAGDIGKQVFAGGYQPMWPIEQRAEAERALHGTMKVESN